VYNVQKAKMLIFNATKEDLELLGGISLVGCITHDFLSHSCGSKPFEYFLVHPQEVIESQPTKASIFHLVKTPNSSSSSFQAMEITPLSQSFLNDKLHL